MGQTLELALASLINGEIGWSARSSFFCLPCLFCPRRVHFCFVAAEGINCCKQEVLEYLVDWQVACLLLVSLSAASRVLESQCWGEGGRRRELRTLKCVS